MRPHLARIGLFVLGSVVGARAAPPPELADAAARWTPLMKEFRVPGMSVAVVREGEVVYSVGLGRRDPDKDAPVTPDTVFFIGSATRPFVVAVALLLEQEGKLELGAPVKKYLPRFQLADQGLAEKLTVLELITQAKGLKNSWIDFRANATGQLDDAALERLLPKSKASAQFDEDVLHAVLLARVIEVASGKSWKDLVRSRILEPAKMSNTFLTAKTMYGAADAAVAVEDLAGDFFISRFPKTDRTMHAGGGIGSSALDLGRWIILNLGAGSAASVLPEPVRSAMQSPRVPADSQLPLIPRESYAMGWYVGSMGGKRLINELGGSVGARAHVSFMPDAKLGVVVLLNIGGPTSLFADAVACDVYQRLAGTGGDEPFGKLRGFLAKNVRPSTDPVDATSRARPAEGAGLSLPAAAYVGRYSNEDWGTVDVTAEQGELYLSFGELLLDVKTAGIDHFEFPLAGGTKHGQFLLGPGKTISDIDMKVDLVHHRFKRDKP